MQTIRIENFFVGMAMGMLSYARAMSVKGILRPLLPPLRLRNQLRVWLRRHPHELRQHYPDIGALGLRPAPVVIDVGANAGQFTSSLLAWRPRAWVHAFEPQREVLAAMKALLRGFDRVAYNDVALGAETGARTFYVSAYDQASSFLPNGELLRSGVYGIDFSTRAEQQVTVRTLQDYVRERAIDRIDLLKLDVQGFELEVLRGALGVLERIDWIYTEAQFKELYAGAPAWLDQHRFLRAHGFELVRMCALRCDDAGEPMECDMVFRRRGASLALR
jgi:FkbM family methyltransferase